MSASDSTGSEIVMYSTAWCGYCQRARNLFERTESPLLPYHWGRAGRDLPAALGFGSYLATDWYGTASPSLPALAAILLAAIVAWIGLGIVVRRVERAADSPPPGGRSFIQRAQKIAFTAA